MSGTNRATLAQTTFMNAGGIFAQVLAKKRDNGELPEEYVYHEYPKMIRISEGFQDVECSTETIRGKVVEWTEHREIFKDIIVQNEDEEERVLSGGKTSGQIEEERQELIARGRAQGLKIDPSWSAVRLRRELGDALDAAPVDEMAALEKRLGDLKKMAEMRAEIERLQAQIAAPKEAPLAAAESDEEVRAQLRLLGIEPDGRWKSARLREELERATAPKD